MNSCVATSVRKHISQMHPAEIAALQILIKGNFRLSRHCIEKMKERRIRTESIKHTILEGNIIEYHLVNGRQSRVLLRSRVPIRGQVTCVVVDIGTNYVVTAYKNWVTDKHKNLNMEEYDENLNILKSVNETLNLCRGSNV